MLAQFLFFFGKTSGIGSDRGAYHYQYKCSQSKLITQQLSHLTGCEERMVCDLKCEVIHNTDVGLLREMYSTFNVSSFRITGHWRNRLMKECRFIHQTGWPLCRGSGFLNIWQILSIIKGVFFDGRTKMCSWLMAYSHDGTRQNKSQLLRFGFHLGVNDYWPCGWVVPAHHSVAHQSYHKNNWLLSTFSYYPTTVHIWIRSCHW